MLPIHYALSKREIEKDQNYQNILETLMNIVTRICLRKQKRSLDLEPKKKIIKKRNLTLEPM